MACAETADDRNRVMQGALDQVSVQLTPHIQVMVPFFGSPQPPLNPGSVSTATEACRLMKSVISYSSRSSTWTPRSLSSPSSS